MASQLLPHDHQHVDSFGFAMERVAQIDRSAPAVHLMDAYRAVQGNLRAHNRPTVPLGTFVRLLRAVGVAVAHEGEHQGNASRYVYRLRLIADD
ncbi:hypothetical protein [Streptomyces sp. NPDC058698]|uniref:hypothetical protein n=1 Tax=Streptomyces sp. NPDC058698 TaxID=3346606 RepID=UPI00365A1672